MTPFQKLRVAVIGCGMISYCYFENMKGYDILEVVGCSDLRPERAKARAETFGVRAMTNEEIWADPTIDLVVNLTWPTAHYDVTRSSLLAGKHVYTEKMTTITCEESTELLRIAGEKGLLVGGAPDTFLGGGIQQARRILDSGLLGTPVFASVQLSRCYRQERSYTGDYKRFAFCPGGGILFDMGAYYFTQLVFLLGAAAKVSGFSQIREPHRVWSNPGGPLYGTPMEIESCNQAAGSILFENGVVGSVGFTSEGGSFDNHFCIYCTDGWLDLGDPNLFHGDVDVVNKKGERVRIPADFGLCGDNLRGAGVADMAYAVRQGRSPRCSGELNRHVLEIARGIAESGDTGRTVTLQYGCARPEPLPIGHIEYPELAFVK